MEQKRINNDNLQIELALQIAISMHDGQVDLDGLGVFLYLFGVAQVVDFHLHGGLVARGFDVADIVHVGHWIICYGTMSTYCMWINHIA